MNVLDENVLKDQRQLLLNWHVPIRQIGYDIGRMGMKDEEIIRLLLQLRHPTFFTLDFDFYQRNLCHAQYCLVCMDIQQDKTAQFVRRLLRHKVFNTKAKRMGKIICLSSTGLSVWQLHADQEISLDWHKLLK
jgi:hypothetical protein